MGVSTLGPAAALSLGAGDVGTVAPEALEGEARIVAAVAQKVDSWRERRERACFNRALEEATLRADSMILDYARAESLQLERPARPPRPEAPPLLRPSDTLTLVPFLGDTL